MPEIAEKSHARRDISGKISPPKKYPDEILRWTGFTAVLQS